MGLSRGPHLRIGGKLRGRGRPGPRTRVDVPPRGRRRVGCGWVRADPKGQAVGHVAARRQHEVETLPRREELDALAHYYHHLRNEHERSQPESSMRRQLEDRLLEIRERFERLLEEWVPDPDLQEEWREYLRNRRPEPSGPPAIRPLVFQGRAEASGSIVEVRRKGDELQVEVDGSPLERVAAEKDLSVPNPALRFRLNGMEFEETFNASPESLRALADLLDQGGSPPWQHASELLADGLIDIHFDL